MRYGLDASNRGSFDDRMCFPAQSSVLDERALLHRVVPEYEIPTPMDCLFFSRGDSDVYQVHTVGPTFYLKVYRPPFRMVRAEAEGQLLADLSARGASVVAAIRRRDGAFASEVVASEGRRPTLLFEEAPAPFGPLTADACWRLGRALARLHAAGDCIARSCAALFEPANLVPHVRRLASEEDYGVLDSLREKLEEHVRSLAGRQEDRDVGWCHCDLVLSNIRRRQDGSVVFVDFGNAAFVSRAWDFSRVWRTLQTREGPERFDEFWAAFLDGYAQLRRLAAGADSPDLLMTLELLRRIRWIGGVIASCPLRMGSETFNREWVRTQVQAVRESAARILERPSE